MGIDTTGIQELILAIVKLIAGTDLKAIELETGLATLLTMFADIWNPIWKAVTVWLEGSFGL
ncbi:MAG: hypothetical protein IJB45_05865 [Clostridia bacterium]|nr:hypothetical protein [Clostridia bacterium]